MTAQRDARLERARALVHGGCWSSALVAARGDTIALAYVREAVRLEHDAAQLAPIAALDALCPQWDCRYGQRSAGPQERRFAPNALIPRGDGVGVGDARQASNRVGDGRGYDDTTAYFNSDDGDGAGVASEARGLIVTGDGWSGPRQGRIDAGFMMRLRNG